MLSKFTQIIIVLFAIFFTLLYCYTLVNGFSLNGESTERNDFTITETEKPKQTAAVPGTVESVAVIEQEPKKINLGNFKLTAYCSCEKCCGEWAENRPKDDNGNDIVYTSAGTIATAGRTIAVDTSVIPYGAEVEINGQIYTAEDCGGAIKGNRIDVYFDNHDEALKFGVQYADVYLTDSAPLC